MAGRETHKYRGTARSQKPPGNENDENDPEAVAEREISEKQSHLRRVADGKSSLHLRQHSGDEVFGDIYPEFLSAYSRGQLQHLEKLFLM